MKEGTEGRGVQDILIKRPFKRTSHWAVSSYAQPNTTVSPRTSEERAKSTVNGKMDPV